MGMLRAALYQSPGVAEQDCTTQTEHAVSAVLAFANRGCLQATIEMTLAQAVMRTAAVRPCAAQGLRGSSVRLIRSPAPSFGRRAFVVNASAKSEEEIQEAPSAAPDAEAEATTGSEASRQRKPEVEREITKIASTFAPRASGGAKKNPAVPGSVLYQVFDVQAWAAVVVGGLLSYNVLLPSEDPTIARLMGMWSIWMFTVPSLRARECTPNEKEALNILFVLIPLINVALPFVWKSFGFVFSADVVALYGVLYWKVWSESGDGTESDSSAQ